MGAFSSKRDQPDRNPERQDGSAPQTVSAAGRERWESAIENPEAKAFLKRAMDRRAKMDREGLIHRP